MTSDQVMLIQDSWTRVKHRGDEILQRFYDRLFVLDPSAHALFGSTDMSMQRKKFAGMIDAILALSQEPRSFVSSAAEMGRRHRAYGVRPEHYDSAGTALLYALRDALGPDLTPELKEAWKAGFKLVSAIMLRAAEQGRPPQRGQVASV